MTATPWAVLLCRFSDNDAEPYARDRYEEIFTSSGAGRWSMPDFFHDVSHGRVDLSGSRVFGWLTLPHQSSDYVGSGANPQGRTDLIDWARAAAEADGIDLSTFFSVAVVMNAGYDLFGGPRGIVAGDDGANGAVSGLAPSLLGQEMGHTYGLQHSGALGVDAEYGDFWDVMSTLNAGISRHPLHNDVTPRGDDVFPIGPGLNAANMDHLGWLDSSRVWSMDSDSPGGQATVQLRPLHRVDLPGHLAMRFLDFYIEFRSGQSWDSGFDPTVLVHILDGGRSYLVADDAGSFAWGVGSAAATPQALQVFGGFMSIRVLSINIADQVAEIAVSRTRGRPPMYKHDRGPFRTPWVVWGDIIANPGPLIVVDGHTVEHGTSTPIGQLIREVADLDKGALRATDGSLAPQNESLARVVEATQAVTARRARDASPLIYREQER